jgi:hypothetical protein
MLKLEGEFKDRHGIKWNGTIEVPEEVVNAASKIKSGKVPATEWEAAEETMLRWVDGAKSKRKKGVNEERSRRLIVSDHLSGRSSLWDLNSEPAVAAKSQPNLQPIHLNRASKQEKAPKLNHLLGE